MYFTVVKLKSIFSCRS